MTLREQFLPAGAERTAAGSGRVPARVASQRWATATMLAAASAGLLAACGGGGGGATGATPQPPASKAPTSPGQAATASPAELSVHSPAFADGGRIPARYSCRSGNTPPPLTWTGLPAGTASVALILDDPDAVGGNYTHWVVFNLPASATGLGGGQLPAGSAQASNSGGQAAYLGPCPPSGTGTHHYRFTVYAERSRLRLPAGAALSPALAAIKAAAITSGRLTGVFSAA